MRLLSATLVLLTCSSPGPGLSQAHPAPGLPVKVALIKMPYTGARNVPELSRVPDYLEEGGIADALREWGASLKPTMTVRLTGDEQAQYGEWNRLGLANAHLARTVAANRREGYLSIGLLGNCTSSIGMLGGLQHSGPSSRPLRVGLLWVDAHGDFNTPETTLSGMLGGMPVAVSAGLALNRLRTLSGVDPALPSRYIVMAGVRDTDPLEQELLDRSEVQVLTVEDLRDRSRLHEQMTRLSELTDVIYVHVDMDVLDPAEVGGHSLTVPGGPSSWELAAVLSQVFEYPKVASLGIASTPSWERDPDGRSREAAYRLIQGALAGVRERHPP